MCNELSGNIFGSWKVYYFRVDLFPLLFGYKFTECNAIKSNNGVIIFIQYIIFFSRFCTIDQNEPDNLPIAVLRYVFALSPCVTG